MPKGNIGEWSEIYTLLKLISDKKLYAGDENLNRINGLVYPIVKILREESNEVMEYSIDNDIVLINGKNKAFRLSIEQFKTKTESLLKSILSAGKGTFNIPEIEDFMLSFGCEKLKAKSSSKSDIRIIIHDPNTGIKPELGFSIKSQLGRPSTLFNSSKNSNFIYEITNIQLTEVDINKINSISTRSKIYDRITEIINREGQLNFIETEGRIFNNNLKLIDSSMPLLLSRLIVLFNSTSYKSLTDLIRVLKQDNPLEFDMTNDHDFYEYKLKRLLNDMALGMTAAKVWNGLFDASGGYLVVKEDGDLLCYHIYNRNQFDDYLISNTQLLNPSTTRMNCGEVYKENGKLFIKLNLQIRFLK